jgi:hypothetical protein
VGWTEKSTGEQWSPCQADRDGSKAEWRMGLRVNSVARIRSHQRSGGKVICAEERTERK